MRIDAEYVGERLRIVGNLHPHRDGVLAARMRSLSLDIRLHDGG
jgi:hypothetical protein